MGLLNFFTKKNAPKPKTGLSPDEKVQATEMVKMAQNIVSDFADFMQTPEYPAPGCIADTSKLPHKKELLQGSFKLLIKASKDGEYRQALMASYVNLADFQDNVGNEDVGFNASKYAGVLGRLDLQKPEDLAISKRIAGMTCEDMEASKKFRELRDREEKVLCKDIEAINAARGMARS